MDLAALLRACPLIAILRGLRPEEAEGIGDALFAAGLRVLEVPLNSPDPLESIRRLASRFAGRAMVGAGTVRREHEVAAVAGAGGQLLVTPHCAPALVQTAKARGMAAVPGFFTPTEAFALLDAGADALKLFPAEAANPAMLRALRAVLPSGTMILPVGGIGAGNLAEWRSAGAAGFGIGSSLYAPGDTPDAAARKAKALIQAL